MKAVKDFVSKHQAITSWIALAIGMVAVLLWAAKDVDLLPGQLAALVIATIILAGACVWIINWE